MSTEFSLSDGKELIGLARKSIEYFSATGSILNETTEKKRFLEKRGCFVTLNTFPDKKLRGCIGYPYPTMSLWKAIARAAAGAAFHDPRFSPVKVDEFDKVVLELSVLTLPEEIPGKRDELLRSICIGQDGLIVKKGQKSGLLLPQVAEEYNWGQEEFLCHCCEKAALPPSMWRHSDCSVFKFQAHIFEEDSPKGEIKEH